MRCRQFSLIFALSFLAGCASIDFDYPKSETYALTGPADTRLGRKIADLVAAHPNTESGFYPVYDGIDSLALRLLLADRAEHTIDAQYFLIRGDLVGNAFISSLLKAANRGVRVRLLVDDVQAGGYDAGLAALDAHENFEVRVFNPFAHRSFRALDAPSASRISRRMHNKSFTIDNQMSIIGGRNIANEYFDAEPGEKFDDLDVLTIGPVVQEVSTMFDTYWNHRAAMPILAFAEVPEDSHKALEILNQRIFKSLEDIANSKYADAVKSSILNFVETDGSAFIWAGYDLVYDSPDKADPKKSGTAARITTQMREAIDVEEELFVVTAYFILRKDDIEGFREVRNRDIEITVLTNSLASNNHTVAHGGYAGIRKELLEMGVKLYELRANVDIPSDVSKGVQNSKSALHAKAFVVDRKKIFIGSFNWNQRSANLDTELGVIIHSPEMAAQLVDLVTESLPDTTYEVFLNEKNKVRWRGHDNGQEVIIEKEPQSGFWRRFNAGFLGMMPIKSQL